MKIFNVMAFRLGSPTSTPVKLDFLNFYQNVAQSVAGEECRYADTLIPSTIPFDNSLILSQPFQIYQRFIEYVRDWKKWPDVVVIDLTNNVAHGIDRGGVLINIAQAIQYTLTPPDAPSDNLPIFTVLLSVLPPEGDLFRHILQPYCERGNVIIISDDGSLFPAAAKPASFISAQYRLSLASVREDPRDRAKVKLIRRLGHFKRTSSTGHYGCVRYSYDGSLCVSELAELLRQRIADEEYTEDAKPLVTYYCPPSHWLEDTVVAVAIAMELDYYKVEELIATSSPKEKLAHVTSALLVVPMVDSGQTLREALEELAGMPIPLMPKVISILSTRSNNDEQRKRVIRVSGRAIEIEYMIKVDQKTYLPGNCPMCALEIPPSDYNSDEYTMLTTYDMWDMSDSAGWKGEDDVPSYRPGLPLVPDYPGMIEQHGAWLMSKVRKRLEELPGGFPADPLVVCPDERGSVIFTNYLTLVLKVTVVRIPREVINMDRSLEVNFQEYESEWQSLRPQWYVQLTTISTEDIIVMDEFNFSGKTRASITVLLSQFGRKPLCYFSLVDFDPNHSKKGVIPSYSLYEFQANHDPDNLSE